MAETHVPTFIYGDVAGERLAKVGVEAFLVPAGTTAPKSYGMELRRRILCHKIEASPLETFMHRRQRFVVVGRLACDVPHALRRKIGANDEMLPMVVAPEARVFVLGDVLTI